MESRLYGFSQRMRWVSVLVLACALLARQAHAATVEDVVTFDSNIGHVNNLVWTHENPSGLDVASATIELDILLFALGFEPMRLLASASSSFNFNDPDQFIGTIDRTTNPNSSEFFKVSFSLTNTQVGWLNDDDILNVALDAPIIVGPGLLNQNIFYIRSSTLTMTPVPLPGAIWLFGSGLLGLIGISRRKKSA